MLKQLYIGLSSYTKAVVFIRQNGMLKYYLVPLVINVFLFVSVLSAVGALTDDIAKWFIHLVNLEKGGEFYDTVGEVIWWLVYILVKIMSWIILHFISGGLMLVILSPLLAYLSEKSEQILEGNEYPFNIRQFVKDVARGMVIAFRNTVIQTLLMLVLMVFALIPIVGWLSPFLMFIIASYFYGFSFIDYICERKKYTLKESIQFMRGNKGVVIGNGAVFSGAMMIPFIGSLIAGFVAITSAVAATLAVFEAQKRSY